MNKPELLQAMLDTVDEPIDRIYVVDNGGVLRDQHIRWPWDTNRIHVADPGYNLGVARSWNEIIRANVDANWWVIACNDIRIQEGSLGQLRSIMEQSTDPTLCRVVMGNEAGWGNHFGLFGVNAALIDTVGWFDENFISIYFEDNDYLERIDKLQRMGHTINLPLVQSHTQHIGNASWKYGDDHLGVDNARTWEVNGSYIGTKREADYEPDPTAWKHPSVKRMRNTWKLPPNNNVK